MPREPKKEPEDQEKAEETTPAPAAKKRTLVYPFNLRDKSRDVPGWDYMWSFVGLLIFLFVGLPTVFAAFASEPRNQLNSGGVIIESMQKSTLPVATTPTPTATATATATVTREETLEKEMFDQVNYQRQLNNLVPLDLDPVLTKVAVFRSEDMAKVKYFSHDPPNGGCNYICALDYTGYPYAWAGENIAWNIFPRVEAVEDVMDRFMASTGHKENILNCHFERVGIGVVQFGEKYYYTQIFEGNIYC